MRHEQRGRQSVSRLVGRRPVEDTPFGEGVSRALNGSSFGSVAGAARDRLRGDLASSADDESCLKGLGVMSS
jgi:hypothetical protein